MRGSTLALSSSRGPPSRVVWLGNTGKLTKAEIMSAMAPFGAVEEIQLKTPGATASTNSRSNVPYAFVIFAHIANAERAVDALAPNARLGARGEVTVRVGFGSDPTQSEKAADHQRRESARDPDQHPCAHM